MINFVHSPPPPVLEPWYQGVIDLVYEAAYFFIGVWSSFENLMTIFN